MTNKTRTLTKADICESIRKKLGYTVKESNNILHILIEIIVRTLESGDNLLISGFGKFKVCDKSQRLGRNPATGEQMMLPARKIVTFSYSASLKDKLNRNSKQWLSQSFISFYSHPPKPFYTPINSPVFMIEFLAKLKLIKHRKTKTLIDLFPEAKGDPDFKPFDPDRYK